MILLEMAAQGWSPRSAPVNGTSGGNYFTDNDGLGNLYFGDNYNNLIREMPLGTQFPATPVVPATAGAWSATATYGLNNVVKLYVALPDRGDLHWYPAGVLHLADCVEYREHT